MGYWFGVYCIYYKVYEVGFVVIFLFFFILMKLMCLRKFLIGLVWICLVRVIMV